MVKIHEYLGHPYWIHKCLNVVRMSIFYYIFPRNLYWTRKNGLKYKLSTIHFLWKIANVWIFWCFFRVHIMLVNVTLEGSGYKMIVFQSWRLCLNCYFWMAQPKWSRQYSFLYFGEFVKNQCPANNIFNPVTNTICNLDHPG